MVHSDFIGVGIRIEDDVLIGDDDPTVLTADCPVDPHEMEKMAAV